MPVRSSIEARLTSPSDGEVELRVRLPTRMKSDASHVRSALFQRLAASRLFAYGDRAGCLKTAQARSGRPFRLDVRQRVIVKAFVSRHSGSGPSRRAALASHLNYLCRSGAGQDEAAAKAFDRAENEVSTKDLTASWASDRHHFRFIISPEHGDRIADLKSYTRDVLARVGQDLGDDRLQWVGVAHFDTDQPHIHVLMRGRRSDGSDLVIPRDYIGYGFRARAQEVAQERLGDLSRHEAERRIWSETEADRFTAFDRRLMAAMDQKRTVADGVGGSDAWTALTRGRLRHLECLGLAKREGQRFVIADDMEFQLRRLQTSRDIIRTLNQRTIEALADVQQAHSDELRGRVVKVGFHDEIGARPFAVIKAASGCETYAPLQAGIALKLGQTVALSVDDRGVARLLSASSRGANLGL